jgi:predicted DNA-binding protein
MKTNLEKVIGIRVTDELYKMLEKVCENRGEDMAGFVRRSILKELATLSFLPPEQKKALGVSTT